MQSYSSKVQENIYLYIDMEISIIYSLMYKNAGAPGYSLDLVSIRKADEGRALTLWLLTVISSSLLYPFPF